MPMLFPRIGLMGKHSNPEVHSTLRALIAHLRSEGHTVVLETQCALSLPDLNLPPSPSAQLGKLCDLLIVVGGDGSLLEAARAVVLDQVPVVGVNRGRRGFLTDISPQALTQSLDPLLNGHYQEERRFLLDFQLLRDGEIIASASALNEIVLYSGENAKIIEFELRINNQFVYSQRSDGLITTTPTGSTAYALAGGGPILHPTLEAIALVPLHPAVLSSRPIVVDSRSQIELHVIAENLPRVHVSCDGQIHFEAKPNDVLRIQRKTPELRLLHPLEYDYYRTLQTKLGWSA